MEKVTTSAKKVVAKTKEETTNTIGNQVTESASTIAGEIKESSKEINGIVKKAVDQVSEKVEFTEGIDKIKDSVKVINAQLKDSAVEIFEEVKDMTEDVAEVATKSTKELTKKVEAEFNASIEKVKTTAKNVEVKVVENAKELKKNTAKLANNVVENLKINDRLTALKNAVINANETALTSTSELIDGLEENGIKWQQVSEKAIKSGLKLAENQQELVFSTLEAVKTQIGATTNRFKKLFQN